MDSHVDGRCNAMKSFFAIAAIETCARWEVDSVWAAPGTLRECRPPYTIWTAFSLLVAPCRGLHPVFWSDGTFGQPRHELYWFCRCFVGDSCHHAARYSIKKLNTHIRMNRVMWIMQLLMAVFLVSSIGWVTAQSPPPFPFGLAAGDAFTGPSDQGTSSLLPLPFPIRNRISAVRPGVHGF
jgi:hypothetical protein